MAGNPLKKSPADWKIFFQTFNLEDGVSGFGVYFHN
jgi:hypothetical protein